MDRRQLTIMANKFQSVFDPSTLNDQGDQLEFCQRQRLITPLRFGLSVVASMASQQVQSIADLQRDFNALWDLEVSYKAFYNQLAKPSCSGRVGRQRVAQTDTFPTAPLQTDRDSFDVNQLSSGRQTLGFRFLCIAHPS